MLIFLHHTGLFGVVERVITQLASGRWEDPPIREPLGGVNSCLYLARYGQDKKSGILWQLDVEFDEAAEALLQLVRSKFCSSSLSKYCSDFLS